MRVAILGIPNSYRTKVFANEIANAGFDVVGVVIEQRGTRKSWQRYRNILKQYGLRGFVFRVRRVLLGKLLGREKHPDLNLPEYTVSSHNGKDCQEILRKLDPDALVIGSARILKEETFSIARMGCLNSHPGWLPSYRGLDSNVHAILDGEQPGVSLHFVDAGIDTGRVIRRERIPVEKGDTLDTLAEKSIHIGVGQVIRVLHDMETEMPELLDTQGEQGKLCRRVGTKERRAAARRLKKMATQ